jgi:hypothetical protein
MRGDCRGKEIDPFQFQFLTYLLGDTQMPKMDRIKSAPKNT